MLDGDATDKLAERLNRAGKDQGAAMWQLVVLHGMSKYGTLQNEVALASLQWPDNDTRLVGRGAQRRTMPVALIQIRNSGDDCL